MRPTHFFAFLIFLLFLCGCENVSSQYPVGLKPHAIDSEEWAGEWSSDCAGQEAIRIEVVDKDKGIIRVIDVKSGQESTMQTYDCYLREAGDWIFANVALKDESDFYPVRVKNVEGRQIIVWFPDPEKFKPLVFDKKALPGEWRGGNLSLGLLKQEHLELIVSGKEGVLFKWDEPVVLIRHGKAPVPRY
jgi:hypothetical protein